MIPLYTVGIAATMWVALVVGLALTSFRPSIRRTYRAPSGRSEVRRILTGTSGRLPVPGWGAK